MLYSLAYSTLVLVLLSRHARTQPIASGATPPDFPDTETPYRVTPTDANGAEATSLNALGTYLYKYTDCSKRFGAGAVGKINQSWK
jgi:hypothetical protein